MNKTGVGTSVPSKENVDLNGTKVPAPEEETKGVGVSTTLDRHKNETKVSTPEYDVNGTEPKGIHFNKVSTLNGKNNTAPRRFLPHIDMIGYYQFITFRTHDSLDDFIKKIRDENISSREQEYKIDQYIDKSPKGCYLNNEVLDYLHGYFISNNKSFYNLVAFSIMPNHVHMLFKQNIELPKIMKQIKGATAFEINKMLQRRGIFWETNYYDKVIRDEAHFESVYDYIAYNALKADLVDAKERFYGIYE